MEERNNNSELVQRMSLVDVCKLFLSRWYLILVVGLIGGVFAGVYTKFMITPMYSSYCTLYVFNKSAANGLGDVSSGDITASADLAETYKVLLNAYSVRKEIAKEVKSNRKYAASNITPEYLGGVVSVSSVNETQVIKITVTTPDPELSCAIANAYAFVSPDEMTKATEVGRVNVVDYARESSSPSSPNVSKNCVLGVLAGALVMIIVLLAKFMLDNVIHDSEDIEKSTGLSVIGNIPSLKLGESSKKADLASVKQRSISNDL